MRWSIFFFIALFCTDAVAQTNALDSLITLAKSLEEKQGFGLDTNYLNLQNTIAFSYWSSKPDTSVLLSSKNITRCKAAKFFKGEIDALKNTGVAYWVKGDYDKALRYYLEALPLAEKIGYRKGQGRIRINISLVYSDQGKYSDALEQNLKSLKICEAIHDLKGLALNYNNIAILYYNQEKYNEAVTYYLKSIELSEQTHNVQDKAMAMSNIAELYVRQKKYEQAIDFYNRSLPLKKEVNDMVGYATNLGGIGEIYTHQMKYAQALDFYLKAWTIQQSIGNKPDMSVLLIGIGNCYYELGDIKNALSYTQRGLTIAQSIGHKKFMRDGFATLAKIYKTQKQFEASLAYYEKFKAYSDSINNQESERKTAMLEAQYQFEKKELALKAEQAEREAVFEKQSALQRTWIYLFGISLLSVSVVAFLLYRNNRAKQQANQLLQQKNNEIILQKDQLEKLDTFRNRILSVVSHDVRSPLNSLSGILQLFQKKAVNAQETAEMIPYIHSKVSQVSGFVDDLLLWAKNQMTKPQVKPEDFSLLKTISETIALLSPQAEMKGVQLNANLEQETLVHADREMIKIVIRNLISNAIKYCRKNDRVEVAIETVDLRIKIIVRDSGTGMAQSKMKELFHAVQESTPGTGNEAGTGLGLMLCKQYVELNDGTICVESVEGQGSTFWFTVPKGK